MSLSLLIGRGEGGRGEEKTKRYLTKPVIRLEKFKNKFEDFFLSYVFTYVSGKERVQKKKKRKKKENKGYNKKE